MSWTSPRSRPGRSPWKTPTSTCMRSARSRWTWWPRRLGKKGWKCRPGSLPGFLFCCGETLSSSARSFSTCSAMRSSSPKRARPACTGIGISPEAQARIFQRFTQADESITRRYGGTGLGTTIAKQLVELMGGEIGLQSEPGKGTSFWFTLTLEKQPALVSQATGITALSGSRILVVSSNGQSAGLLKAHLDSWGVSTVVVDKASQAFSPLISAANEGLPYQVAIIVESDLDMDPCDLGKALKSARVIQNVQLILVSKEENEPDLGLLATNGVAVAVGASP